MNNIYFNKLEKDVHDFYLRVTRSFIKSSKENNLLKLKDADSFSYSAILRELRKNNKDKVEEFRKLFKKYFDEAIQNNEKEVDKISLINTLNDMASKYQVEIDDSFIKNASAIELGDPEFAGKYLSDIIKFVMQRVPSDKRLNYLIKLKNKLTGLDEFEISSKNVPASSAIGQSITFIKHILLDHNPEYIRKVLNNIAKHLV